ncbi:MAG: nitrile hydratase subunit alpha [Streptosporangiales bacterium]|nr:nitrile hydratase subunit alpha [Streptosporangiales bacterium]
MTDTHHATAAMTARVRRLEELLEQKGVLRGADTDAFLERFLTTATPRNGARIAARAWVDDAFRQRLLADADSAVQELGYSMNDIGLRVVENTADTHNVIVCTLCSCYPLPLLGPPPSWYKSEAYRARVVRDPRGVLQEFGLTLPATTAIDVWDSTSELRYMVLPRRPADSSGRTEEELADLVTRDGLVGTATV